MHIVKYRKFYFILPVVLLIASLGSIFTFGLKPGVDLQGGSLLEVSYSEERPEVQTVVAALNELNMGEMRVQPSGDKGFMIRMREVTVEEKSVILEAVSRTETAQEERFTTIGATIGDELRSKGWVAIVFVSLTVILYVAFVFRNVRDDEDKQDDGVPSWKYGFIAILTLLHDIIIPTGLFAVLGFTQGAEVDSLFIVAILTILGISINDTIVVFDRIRENLRKNKQDHQKEAFEHVVGRSMDETTSRSINTSLVVVIALIILYIFGPELTRAMALTLMVGMIAGTYSSLFLAAPLLVELQTRQSKRAK